MSRHALINKLKRALPSLGVPIHELPGTATAPPNCRWPGLWLQPEGVYLIRRYGASVGRIAHEAGHWALCPPAARAALTHECLCTQDIDTLGTDMAAEAWAGAAGLAAGIGIEHLFTDLEDYQIGVSTVYDEYSLGLTIGIRLLQKTHPGVMILRLLDMCGDYPKMTRWLAGDDQVYLWTEFEKEVKSNGNLLRQDCEPAS